MPKAFNALIAAQAVLRGLTYKDDKITSALEAIASALEELRVAQYEAQAAYWARTFPSNR